jgi:hypothetical protein
MDDVRVPARVARNQDRDVLQKMMAAPVPLTVTADPLFG